MAGQGDRYYGWRLSRSTFGRPLEFARCTVYPDGSTDCIPVGIIRFQADFSFNGRQVRSIDAEINSEVGESFESAHGMLCYEIDFPFSQCASRTSDFDSLPPLGTDSHTFDSLYLEDDQIYDILFQWAIYDSVTDSTAVTPLYDSLDFQCDRSLSPGDPDYPGECYYPQFEEGDSS